MGSSAVLFGVTDSVSAATRQPGWRYHLTRASVIGLLALTAVIGLQFWTGGLQREVAGDPDEAGHFVTGVMVYDYLRSAAGQNPVEFAEAYYVRYPKVGFGHWPPVFYCVQAVWYFLVGPSKLSALLLMNVLMAALVFATAERAQRLLGAPWAFVAALIILTLPITITYSSLVMADSLVAFLSILAVFQYSDFLRKASWRPLLAFLVLTMAAIFTKGTAIALLLFMLLAPLCCRPVPQGVWRKIGLVLLGSVALTAPYYVICGILGLDMHANLGRVILLTFLAYQRLWVVGQLLSIASPLIFALASVGTVVAWRRHVRRAGPNDPWSVEAPALAAWVLSVLLFQILCYITGPARYFLAVTPALAILAAAGIRWATQRVAADRRGLQIVVCLGLIGVAAATAGKMPVHQASGYAQAAEAIPAKRNRPVVLVSSDVIGEGAFIVERMVRDPDRTGIVLRGSKVLAASDWFGRGYEAKFETPESLRNYLQSLPVRYVGLDDAAYVGESPPEHHRLLRSALESDEAFVLVGRYPIHRRGELRSAPLLVYENQAATESPRRIELDMGRRLGRTFELRLD